MEKPRETNPPSSVNPTPDRASKPYIGGADSVEKTSYVADVHGAEVNDAEVAPVGLTAEVRHRGGLGLLGWIALVLVALVIVAYAAGLFS
jgi:hypothetical protein